MKICKIEDCGKPHVARGYCPKHYQRFMKDGTLKKKEKRPTKKSHPEYNVWIKMKARCRNIKDKRFDRYGGRGIKVCDRWEYNFDVFYEDMGPRPFPKAQIDRKDNDGNYEPGNCKWTTQLNNARNKSNIKLTYKKAENIRKLYNTNYVSQRELAVSFGVSHKTIFNVLNNFIWNRPDD